MGGGCAFIRPMDGSKTLARSSSPVVDESGEQKALFAPDRGCCSGAIRLQQPFVLMVAGPNGAGKTTLTQ